MYQSTHLAVAVAGVGASLPGAVAPDEFAFVGLVEGFGGGVVVGGTHGSGRCLDALVDESSGVGDGQVLRSAVAVVDQALEVAAVAVLALPDRLLQGAARVVGVHARAGGPADDAAGVQVHDERRATSTPTGSARGRRSTTHLRFGPVAAVKSRRSRPVGPGPPRRARWRGAFCRGRPPTAPAPACAAPRCTGPPRGAPVLGVEEAPGLPGSQRRVERLVPQGEDPLVHGGVRDRPLRGRAGPGGVIGGRGDPAP